MKMQSVMSNQHKFSQAPQAIIPRSVFNRTHAYKTTFNSGYLIPFHVDEALPGDTHNLQATLFARLVSPLKTPIMDNMYLDTHYFFVPYRLLWDNFVHFMGEKDNPTDSTVYILPTITSPSGGFTPGGLEDYFGLPTTDTALTGNTITVMSLFHRAYNLIYNEWYRDQNLQNSVAVDKDNGPDTLTDYVLLKRNKRHDYFTSGLPWPQKGDAITIDIGADVYVQGIAKSNQTFVGSSANVYESDGTNPSYADYSGTPTHPIILEKNPTLGNYPNVHVDLTSVEATSINDLREAFQLQKLLERDARGGTRYTEIVRSHFSVVSPDSRLQRPEYLGGKTTPINIQTVAQTGQTATTPQGNLTGVGQATSTNDGFTKSFTEHGLVMGILSVRADLTYQQGIPRMFSRSTKHDFYWPALAHLGEQEVLNKEIYAQGTSADDDVFAYQERWSEYRYYPSKITGELRSTHATPLDTWHLSQEFTSLPTLDSDFIEENPPIDRVSAVTSQDEFILDSFIQNRTARPMPVYSVPGLIDHL